MNDLKSRQKSREKINVLGFGPSENQQPNRQPFTFDQPKDSTLTRPPALTGLGAFETDRESHRSKRSTSQKRRAKETTLMGVDVQQKQFAFEPVDTEKFKTIGSYGSIQPLERDHSETSKRSSKSKKKPKDAVLLDAAPVYQVSPPTVASPVVQQQPRRVVEQFNPPQLQPQPAAKKQVYDLTYEPAQQEVPSNPPTDRTSERSSSKGSKKKPKEGTLFLGQPTNNNSNKPFTFGDVVQKKQTVSIPSSTPQQLDYSEVNSVQFQVSQFNIPRENRFAEDNKQPARERKRKEANRLGNLFEERNKSRSIENISKISEATSKQRSRIGQLFRERKSQEKQSDQSKVMESSKRPQKLSKPSGDDGYDHSSKPVGEDLCSYVQAYQAAKPLEVRMQQPAYQSQKPQQHEQSPQIFKDDAPSRIPFASSPYSPYSQTSFQGSPVAPPFIPGPKDLPKLDLPIPTNLPSANSILSINSPSNFNERNSILKYSTTPPKDDPVKQPPIGQQSLFFNLQNDEKLAASRKKKGLHVLSFKEGPIVPTGSKKDLTAREDNQSARSTSHEKKKVKESTLETLMGKPNDKKFFDFKVRNSPNKVNDSYYSDDAPALIPEPPQSQRETILPAVIKFDDQPPKTYGSEAMKNSFTPIVSRTADNFYPQNGASSSIYEPSVQSASSSIKPPYCRPPSCKKSMSSKRSSSKRSSSKEGSLLDSSEEPDLQISKHGKKLTLNEVAQLRRGQYPNREEMNDSRFSSDRSQSKKRKKESCMMENCQSQSGFTGKSGSDDGSQRSRSASREKNMMIDSSKVSEWLPSHRKEQRKARRAEQASRHESHQWGSSQTTQYKTSLDEFIKPVSAKQGAGSYYLQEYLSNPQDNYEDDEPEERVNFNERFGPKPARRKCMPRTEKCANRY